MISISGSAFLILFATANKRVKCPNPTPLVGKKTMLSLFSPILLPIGYDSELFLSRWPSFSLANLTNSDGIVKGSNRNLTGLRNDDSSRFPSLNEAEPLTL